jgi:hypothetical protein
MHMSVPGADEVAAALREQRRRRRRAQIEYVAREASLYHSIRVCT